MAVDTADEVRAMAGDVLAQLADPEEYLPTGGGVLVDPLTTSDDDYPGAERFNVSFGTRDGWRAVEVAVVPTSDAAMRASMAWAAFQIADAFQDEIIELLHAPRPMCPGHNHPMVPRVDGPRAWWECPSRSSQRRPLWPLIFSTTPVD